MAKRLKEGRDAGGFAIEEEGGGKCVEKERKKKRKHSRNNLHSPSEFSDSKEEATLVTDLTLAWPKRKKERRNSKKKGKGKKGEQKRNRDKYYYKEKYGSPVCLDRGVPPKVSLLNNV